MGSILGGGSMMPLGIIVPLVGTMIPHAAWPYQKKKKIGIKKGKKERKLNQHIKTSLLKLIKSTIRASPVAQW